LACGRLLGCEPLIKPLLCAHLWFYWFDSVHTLCLFGASSLGMVYLPCASFLFRDSCEGEELALLFRMGRDKTCYDKACYFYLCRIMCHSHPL
jgi:hypothetical protein